jgi:hypothetical protein
MPRRRFQFDDSGFEEDFSNTLQEPEDVRVAPGIPTLYEIRKHITEHAWNGDECLPSMTNEQVFDGQCEYASTAISEILTGTGKGFGGGNWSHRVRGWYGGDLSAIKSCSGCDDSAFTEGKHCHSWVEFGGKIIDPTWWQFAGDEVRVYVFELGDPRFVRDENA